MTQTTNPLATMKGIQSFTRNGMTLPQLAAELQRQKETKRDFLAPSEQIEMKFEAGKFFAQVGDLGEFEGNQLFHDQLSSHYKIPKPYYERIQADYPELLAETVNAHLQKTKEKRLVRTMDGRARAFLSAGYRPMDNVDLTTNAILPAFGNVNELLFDCQITETRLYVKAVTPKVQGEIVKGDVVQAGVMIRNSEVGHSSLSIEPFINRLVCTNGLIMPDYGVRKFHTGKRNLELNEAQELMLSDKTRMMQDATLWSQIRDIITATTTQASFNSMIKPMQEAAGRKIESKPTDAVEVVAEWYGFSEEQQTEMLNNLITGNDFSQWGIVNAVTAMAHTETDYDYATELQSIGGELLTLEKKDLKLLLTA